MHTGPQEARALKSTFLCALEGNQRTQRVKSHRSLRDRNAHELISHQEYLLSLHWYFLPAPSPHASYTGLELAVLLMTSNF